MIKRTTFFSCLLLIALSQEFFGIESGGVRSWGMGNASTALYGDSGAVYHNPAGIAGVILPELSVNAGHFKESVWSGSLSGLVFVWPWPSHTGKAAALHWNSAYDGTEYVRETGLSLAWQQESELHRLAWGTTLKWREDSLRFVQSGLIDLGIQKTWKQSNITGGMMLRNLLSPSQHAAELSPAAGIVYHHTQGNLACDVNWRTDGPYVSLGIERNIFKGLMVARAGYHGAPEALYTVGMTSQLQPLGFDTSYSWPAKGSESRGYFQVALNYRFGVPSFSKTYINWEEFQEQERKKRDASARSAAEAERRSAAERARQREQAGPRWPQMHRVVQGDTLRALAQRYYGNANKWQILYKANSQKIERGQPRIGETIVIPEPK